MLSNKVNCTLMVISFIYHSDLIFLNAIWIYMELLNYPTTLCLPRLLLLKRNDLVQAVLYASAKWLHKVHSITIGLSMECICSNDSYIHWVSLNDLVFFLLYREKITFQYIDPKSICLCLTINNSTEFQKKVMTSVNIKKRTK